MPALSKFLVLLALVLSASHANAFTSLSWVAGNQVRINHLTRLQQPMSDPTNEPSREPIREPTKRMDLNALLPNNLSQINNAVLSNHSKQRVSFADQPGIDEEINNPTAASDSSKNQWHMPTPINLESSGLRRSSRTEVLARRGLVYSNTTLMDQDEGMTKPQNTHLRSASQRSFSSVRVPFSTICPLGGLSCWVQSLAVKVQVSSTPTVSRHAFTLFAFEPVTSTNQISSAKTASKASAEMQPLADSNKIYNASSFDDKPSSTFQLVVASVDWKSNLGYNQHESSCASLLVACAKCLNSHESSCASRLAARAQCLKSHEASCIFHLVARAKCHNKSNVFAFRLIVGFIQKSFQSRFHQDLVDLSLSNTFSISKLDFISIKAKSNSAMLIDLPTSQRKAMIHFYDGSSQFIVKYIYLLDSEGAKTAISCKSTTFGANSVKLIETRTSQQSTMLYFNGGSSRLIVGYIYSSNSEGARSPPTTFTITQAHDCQRLIVDFIAANESNHEGAWAQATSFQTSKLIVIYSKKSLHFREDCGMFCEGEWEEQSQQPKHYLVDHYRVIGRANLIDRISLVGSIGFSGISGLAGQISLVSLSSFIGHVSFIDLGVSFIGLSIVGFIGLSLVSLGGLIGHFSLSDIIGQVSLINLSASSNHWPIGLISVIGVSLIASSASAASLARRLISFVGLIGSSTHRLFCERLATAVNEATKLTWRLKQAAALGVATLRLSANEIANATISYYYAVTSLHMHSLVREKMWWWLALARKKMWRWIASFGESYSGDVLQYAKQLFSLRLPQMTKYCVMRECDNIHPWISTTGDLAFSHQQEFTVLNSQKGFRRSLPEISLFSLSSLFD